MSVSAAMLKSCYCAQEIDSSTEGGVNPEAGPHDSAAGTKTASLKRKYMVGRVALRTLFFDTHLLDAVTAGPPAAIKQACLRSHPIHPGDACTAVLFYPDVRPLPTCFAEGLGRCELSTKCAGGPSRSRHGHQSVAPAPA